MNPAVTVANTIPVVSLDEMKKYLRYEHTTDNDFEITSLIMAMQEQAEAATNRRLLTTTMQYKMKRWWKEYFKLPYGSPLQEVSSIQYYDSDNNLQTLDTSNYEVYTHKEPGEVRMINAPSVYDRDDAIIITYKSGWTEVDDVPELIKLWIKIRVTDVFNVRQSQVVGASVSPTYNPDMLLMKDRVIEL